MRPTLLFCGLPLIFSYTGVVLSLLFGPILIASPVLLPYAALIAFGAISAFIAYFHDRIPNRIAWPAILFAGLAIVLNFAFLHASAGILCAAALCTGSTLVTVGAEEVRIYSDFTTAAYFSVVTFTTLGFGDLQPMPHARMLAALQASFGYLYLGLLVGAAVHWGSSTFGGEPPAGD